MQGNEPLKKHYNLEDALVIAEFLNAFVRNADVVKIAIWRCLFNVIAPIFTNENGIFKQTTYFPLALFDKPCCWHLRDVFVNVIL
jgi:alpha-N-arabinofuranosidase